MCREFSTVHRRMNCKATNIKSLLYFWIFVTLEFYFCWLRTRKKAKKLTVQNTCTSKTLKYRGFIVAWLFCQHLHIINSVKLFNCCYFCMSYSKFISYSGLSLPGHSMHSRILQARLSLKSFQSTCTLGHDVFLLIKQKIQNFHFCLFMNTCSHEKNQERHMFQSWQGW